MACTVHAAQPAKGKKTGPTLDLPRLRQHIRSDLVPFKKSMVSVDDLSEQGVIGVSSVSVGGVRYIDIEGGKEISRSLRESPGDITFVSFFAYASDGTTIDIGGARVQIKAAGDPAELHLLLGDSSGRVFSQELKGSLKLERHDKISLAPLPIITLRLDRSAGVWDVFIFEQLLVANLPLDKSTGIEKKFRLQAGTGRAWLLGLVIADENPLCEDANRNGIDDVFEKKQGGVLLAAEGGSVERVLLMERWKQSQHGANYTSWKVRRVHPIKR